MKLHKKSTTDESLANQSEAWLQDDNNFDKFICHEASIEPPLKHFWGPISIGAMILLLSVT